MFALRNQLPLLVELLLFKLALFLLEVFFKLSKTLLVVSLKLSLFEKPFVLEVSLASLDIRKRVS